MLGFDYLWMKQNHKTFYKKQKTKTEAVFRDCHDGNSTVSSEKTSETHFVEGLHALNVQLHRVLMSGSPTGLDDQSECKYRNWALVSSLVSLDEDQEKKALKWNVKALMFHLKQMTSCLFFTSIWEGVKKATWLKYKVR